jgi:hypothetical protein
VNTFTMLCSAASVSTAPASAAGCAASHSPRGAPAPRGACQPPRPLRANARSSGGGAPCRHAPGGGAAACDSARAEARASPRAAPRSMRAAAAARGASGHATGLQRAALAAA